MGVLYTQTKVFQKESKKHRWIYKFGRIYKAGLQIRPGILRRFVALAYFSQPVYELNSHFDSCPVIFEPDVLIGTVV